MGRRPGELQAHVLILGVFVGLVTAVLRVRAIIVAMLLSLRLGSLPYFALLPACLLPAGRWAAHALSVSCCRCWPLWMSKQGDVIDQLDRVVKLFTHPKTPFVFLFFPNP